MTRVLLLICLGSLLVKFFSNRIFLQRLEKWHPNVWIAMGSPKNGDSNLSAQSNSLRKFIWMFKFGSLENSILNKIGWIVIIGEFGAMVSFVAAMCRACWA